MKCKERESRQLQDVEKPHLKCKSFLSGATGFFKTMDILQGKGSAKETHIPDNDFSTHSTRYLRENLRSEKCFV